jgi:signal transduction histidine kinase
MTLDTSPSSRLQPGGLRNILKRAWRSRRIPVVLLIAASLIAILSAPIVGPLSAQLRALNGQRMARREHAQEVANVRKAARKAQLALAELWLAPVEQRPKFQADLASRVRDVESILYGAAHHASTASSSGQPFTQSLSRDLIAWSQAITEALPPGGSPKPYESVREKFERVDRACEDFTADDNRLAKEADATTASLERRVDVYNVGLGSTIVALLGVAIVRLVRDRSKARIRAAEEARRAQELQNEELECRVAERTQELEQSNRFLQQSMAALQETQQALTSKLGELAEARNQLLHAEKLEAVGRLAAGIAHEINTPTQFVGDNLHYLAQSFADILVLVDEYRRIAREVPALRDDPSLQARLKEVEDSADLEFLRENIEPAFERAKDGVSRIAGIVRAMKEFSHPSSQEKEAVDINRALLATLTIAKNEYKYVADVETDLGELPMVRGYAGDLNQVFLNLIVNAAHAIADVGQESSVRGKIRIRTTSDEHSVCIEIADTGCGIPESIRGKVFEPFFTTKKVGRGTGQGLPIARSMIVDKHGGSLTFESEVGRGTVFRIRLPIEPDAE